MGKFICTLLCLFMPPQLSWGMPVLDAADPVIDNSTLVHWLQGWYGAFSRELDPAHADEMAPFGLLTDLELEAFIEFLLTGELPSSVQEQDKVLHFSAVQIRHTVRNTKLFLRELYRRRNFELLRSVALANPIEAPKLDRALREAAAVYIGWMYEDNLGWSFSWTLEALAQTSDPKIRYAVIQSLEKVGNDRGSLNILLNMATDYNPLLTTVTSTTEVAYGSAIREIALRAYQQHGLAREFLSDMLGPLSSSEPAMSCELMLGR